MVVYIPTLVLTMLMLASAPIYVQGGDTAELVAAAYHKLVAHPPGYPLYLWLQHAWTHVIPFQTVFWRASALSVLFGMGTLIFSLMPFKGRRVLSLLPLVMLGLKGEFLETSLLPDVFSLHGLLVALVCFLYLYGKERRYLIGLIFVLSFTNHHTMILLVPLVIEQFYESWSQGQGKRFFLSASLGFIALILLYASLLLLDVSHPLSWGLLSNPMAVVDHFLRRDYGTFQLAPGASGFDASAFAFLLNSLASNLFLALVVFAFSWKKVLKDRRFLSLSLSLLMCFAFSLMMNVPAEGMGKEVLARFHLMPLIVLSFWTGYLLLKIDLRGIAAAVIGSIVVLLGLWEMPKLRKLPAYRNDSTIEDYANNLLKVADERKPVVIVANNDSAYFALRYMRAFNSPKHSEVAVVSLPLFFHPWYLPKVQTIVPDLKISETVSQSKTLKLKTELIDPNLEKINFILNEGMREGSGNKLTFYNLGRVVSQGEGFSFESTPMTIKRVPGPDDGSPQVFSRLKLFYEYSHYYLAKAHEAVKKQQVDQAVENWELAVEKVPYCHPAMENLCRIFPERYPFCDDLEKFKELTKGFY